MRQTDLLPIPIGQSEPDEAAHHFGFALIESGSDFLDGGDDGGVIGVVDPGFIGPIGALACSAVSMDRGRPLRFSFPVSTANRSSCIMNPLIINALERLNLGSLYF